MSRAGVVAVAVGALAVSGCATVSGRSQYVSVDSSPRGLAVRDANDPQQVRTTPFFAKQPRRLAQRWVRADDTVQEVGCAWRWSEAGFGNLAPAGIGLALGVGPGVAAVIAANAIDLLDGAAFECPEEVRLEPGNSSPAAAEACPSYVVAPPRHPDEKVAREVQAALGTALATGCATVVPEERARPVLRRIGVAHETGLEVARMRRSALNELGYETGASHVVVPRIIESAEGIAVTSAVFELHRWTEAAGPSVTVAAAAPKREGLDWEGIGAKVIAGIPNTFVLGIAAKELPFQASGGWRIDRVDAPFDFGSTFANFEFLNLDHPDAHQRWEAQWQLSPDVVVAYNTRVLTLSRDDSPARTTPVSVLQAAFTYGPRLTIHTPLGQLATWAAGGAGLASHWEPGDPATNTVRLYGTLGVSWALWVSDSAFVGLRLAQTKSWFPHVVRPEYQLDELRQAWVTIGVQLPEAKRALRDLL